MLNEIKWMDKLLVMCGLLIYLFVLPFFLKFFHSLRLVQLEKITPRCPCILVSSSPSYIRVVRQV